MTRILTSHVGSLPRSQEVVDFIFARENNENYDETSFDEAMTKAVHDTVGKQTESGIDIVPPAKPDHPKSRQCHACQCNRLGVFIQPTYQGS